MTLLADLADFVHDHRPHGPLTADATEPAWNVQCSPFRCLFRGASRELRR